VSAQASKCKSAGNEVNGIMSAFSAGILIYVALTELANPTMARHCSSSLGRPEFKALAFVGGVLVMFLVNINATREGAGHVH